jgi:hypothetical protein
MKTFTTLNVFFLKKISRLTVILKPSGGASNHESSESNKSNSEIPGFLGHFRVTESVSRVSSSSSVSSSTGLGGCGNIVIPASETAQDASVDKK